MNIIFLDIDGVIVTMHKKSKEDIERRIKNLSEITNELDCSIVLSTSSKDSVSFNPLIIYGEFMKFIFDLFNKYNIKCIDKTPNIKKYLSKNIYTDVWKEDEIIHYLEQHSIDHICIIDDDDAKFMFGTSDLDKVRDYLVTTLFASDDYDEEGLLIRHKDEIKKILKKENKFKKKIIN